MRKIEIPGVVLHNLVVYRDDRGWLSELATCRNTIMGQSTLTMSYPGVIKAFHWHSLQWDYWVCVKGDIQVVLYDLREDLPTHKSTKVVYLSSANLQRLVIPPRVAHGYRVLGNEPAMLLYHTSKVYDPLAPDENRIPYNDPEIGFCWSTEMK